MPAWFLLLWLFQTPAESPAAVVHPHDGFRMALSGPDVQQDRASVLKLVEEQRTDELGRELERIAATDERIDQQTLRLGEVLNGAASQFLKRAAGEAPRQGASDPEIRRACLPWVRKVVEHRFRVPVHPGLWQTQLDVVIAFGGIETDAPPAVLRTSPRLQREFVSQVVALWEQVIESCLVYGEAVPVSVITGDEEQRRKEVPMEFQSVDNFVRVGESNTARVRRHQISEEYHEVTTLTIFTSRYRSRYLKRLRKTLAEFYGPSRTEWHELRQIVRNQVADELVAQRVLNDLLGEGEPAPWP